MKLVPAMVLSLILLSCNDTRKEVATGTNPIAYDTPKNIHEVEVHLKPAVGEELFKANCLTCHSLRYIEMQPDFPRKTWVKIVDKMIHSFGAPIDSTTADAIVNYLVEVKGKK